MKVYVLTSGDYSDYGIDDEGLLTRGADPTAEERAEMYRAYHEASEEHRSEMEAWYDDMAKDEPRSLQSRWRTLLIDRFGFAPIDYEEFREGVHP